MSWGTTGTLGGAVIGGALGSIGGPGGALMGAGIGSALGGGLGSMFDKGPEQLSPEQMAQLIQQGHGAAAQSPSLVGAQGIGQQRGAQLTQSAMGNAGIGTINQTAGNIGLLAMQRPEQSLAELQRQQGLADAIRQQRNLAMSQPGVNPALAGRTAAQAGEQMMVQGNMQSALLRAQEEDAWRKSAMQGLGMAGQLQSTAGQLGMDATRLGYGAEANLMNAIAQNDQFNASQQNQMGMTMLGANQQQNAAAQDQANRSRAAWMNLGGTAMMAGASMYK